MLSVLSAGPGRLRSSYTTMGKYDVSHGICGHRNSGQGSGIPCAASPSLWPTSLQHAEARSSPTREKSHARGCAWSARVESEKRQGPVNKDIDISFSRSQRYVDNVHGTSRVYLSKAASQRHDSEMYTCKSIYQLRFLKEGSGSGLN